MRRLTLAAIVAAILALLGIVTATQAGAAPVVERRSTTATITVQDDSGGLLPVAAAARLWNRNGAVQFQTGSCSGPLCIHVAVVDTHPVGTCSEVTAGCAYLLTDGTCQVEVTRFYADPPASYGDYMSRYLKRSVTAHEIGHCAGRPHSGDPTSLMFYQQSPTDPVKVPNAADLAGMAADWADGYQAPAV